jgi:integrase
MLFLYPLNAIITRMYAPFTLFKRPNKKGGFYYYARFRQPDGTRGKKIATGKTSKGAAVTWCLERLRLAPGGSSPRLEEVAKDFYAKESPYLRHLENLGKPLPSENHRYITQLQINKHVIPNFGNLKIYDTKPSTVSKILEKIDVSTRVRRSILDIVRKIYDWAIHEGWVQTNPAREISVTVSQKQKKRAFLQEEAEAILKKENWKDLRHWALNVVAAEAGMRKGELLALHPSDLEENTIHITRTYSVRTGLKEGTKTGEDKSRRTILTARAREALESVQNGLDYYFIDCPIKAINDHLDHAIEQALGMSKAERQKGRPSLPLLETLLYYQGPAARPPQDANPEASRTHRGPHHGALHPRRAPGP